jgi:membrane-associated phospholipid phosphatase
MWLSDRHWASDIAAGALLGEAIGSSVGEAFRNTSPALGQVSILLPGDGVALVWVGMW